MRVLVLTTSYPRSADDAAGTFVASAVARVRAEGVDVEVISPASFRHFGIAYGHGIVGNLRARPWLAVFLPLFLWNFRRAAARVECDVVHAHWLVSGAVAATLRRPFLVQAWGTDVVLAQYVPRLVRRILRRARLVVVPSDFLATELRALGARTVRVIPTPVDVPAEVPAPEEPPHVLYVGRLSLEKGIEEFLRATEGLRRVVVGAGPVAVGESVGAVAPNAVAAFLARAAVVCVPSRREGYGVVAREAMANGRPVVATAVGGLADAIEDGVTGLLVPPRDVPALRAAVLRLLNDAQLRARIGAAAQAAARRQRDAGVAALLVAYEDVASGTLG
jgi:glycosyltransferase involved in cell wall biosynthesis